MTTLQDDILHNACAIALGVFVILCFCKPAAAFVALCVFAAFARWCCK